MKFDAIHWFLSRLCRCQLHLEGIGSVLFRGPSYVGERVFIQTSVNRVFSNKRYSSLQIRLTVHVLSSGLRWGLE